MKLPAGCDSITINTRSTDGKSVIMIGIYGIPGSGKTHVLSQLEQKLEEEPFTFYDGSQVIAMVVPGGLDTFQKLEEEEQMHWREVAINKIKKDCIESGRAAVVAGHFMFWPEGEDAGQPVYTQSDLQSYTHILYLDTPADAVAQRRLDDTKRSRPLVTAHHLHKWQAEEKTQLIRLCREHDILFAPINDHTTLLDTVSVLLRDFQHHNEEHNLRKAAMALDETIADKSGQLNTLLVLDADRTLAAEDTGTLFWEHLRKVRQSMDESCPLRALFSGPLGYTHTAFRQAVLLYEAATTDQEYNALCEDIAAAVTMHSEFISLLQFVARQDHIRAVVVSCGLRRVWEAVLEKAGLSSSVKVIAGGRISDGYVVTGAVKADLVTHAREHHKLYVWAFGDSVLDLGMLKNADRAVVVTGDERIRSKTMDGPLEDAIDNSGLRAHQVLLPGHVWPRLTTTKLPLIDLTNKDFTANILGLHTRRSSIELVHATNRNASKLLMTRMRDATVFGSNLREVHGRVGQYLATEFLSQVIGVEEYPIPHVQGHTSSGYRLLHERQTLIVALMRGGEPMAFGVNEVFPDTMFLHANSPGDVLNDHVKEKLTVILVDSVVNSGKTIVEFVQHIRNLHATIRIVVVAGVVQAQCMSEGLKPLDQDRQLSLVALRLSDNKFTGKGTTDTGNRLFNTTHLA